MANPWLKKNPFMSLWLSAFNAAAYSVTAHAMEQGKRQATIAMAKARKTVFDAWVGGMTPAPAKKRRRR